MWLYTTDTDAVLRDGTDAVLRDGTDAVLREAVDLHKPTQDIVAYFPLYHHILHGVKRHLLLIKRIGCALLALAGRDRVHDEFDI